MSGSRIPDEPPPPYSQAPGSSSAQGSATVGPSSGDNSNTSNLNVPGASSSSGTKDAIPNAYRRSMEDEIRPLPEGWVRTFDPSSDHQFFVDTTKDPPKSIWHHPYDDDDYLATLSPEARERIEQDSMNRGRRHPSKEDIIGAHSDDEDEHPHTSATGAGGSSSSNTGGNTGGNIPQELPPRTDGKGKKADNRSFGRKFKDKVTGMTHEQRVQERKKRAEAEQRMYEQHLRVRKAMSEAMRTGQPQYIGKDRDGKDVYMEPPRQGPGYGPAYGGYGQGGYGYSPYVQPGVYSTPNGRYLRPQGPYGRPYGSGFGGGYGVPLGIGGGLLGGLLIGDMLGGGF